MKIEELTPRDIQTIKNLIKFFEKMKKSVDN